jgi:hypothetical protein
VEAVNGVLVTVRRGTAEIRITRDEATANGATASAIETTGRTDSTADESSALEETTTGLAGDTNPATAADSMDATTGWRGPDDAGSLVEMAGFNNY